ncbi:MAG TPA: glycosyltransferase family 4 protein [Longimicrobium sp.]|nr:glycosyltransferase family 4 protein [Longimicrobium sp.]
MGGLKIGYLVQQFPPEVGAGPARVTEMALRWRDAGAEVVIVTAMPNRPEGRIHAGYRGKLFLTEEWEGMRVHRSWLYASPRHGFARTLANNATFMATAALSALMRLERPDVLIASSPPFFPHVAGAAVSRLRRIPLVLEIRDLWPDYLVGMGVLKEGVASRALFALERRLLRAASHTVVVTESFRHRVVVKGVAPERVDVIPNGVDTARYHPARDEPPVPALARAPGEFLVGYLGNFGAGQGLAAVVEAAACLARRAPEVRFVLAGDGPDRERVLARAAALGTPNLTVGPAIPKERTRAFYNCCDVCLVPLAPYPILQETVPSKIFEVMACERPVLAALAGEGARIVERARAGLVVPPGDPEALAQAVLALRDAPPEERAAMGQRGRLHVAEHFSRDVLAARYLEILGRVADPAPPRPLRAAVRPA